MTEDDEDSLEPVAQTWCLSFGGPTALAQCRPTNTSAAGEHAEPAAEQCQASTPVPCWPQPLHLLSSICEASAQHAAQLSAAAAEAASRAASAQKLSQHAHHHKSKARHKVSNHAADDAADGCVLDLSFERLPSLEGALQGRHVSKLRLKNNLLTSLAGTPWLAATTRPHVMWIGVIAGLLVACLKRPCALSCIWWFARNGRMLQVSATECFGS